MDSQTLQATINTGGILFTIMGAILIAVDVTRQYRGHSHESIVQQDPDSMDSDDYGIVSNPEKTQEFLKWEATNKRLMIWGLVSIFLGGILQIWASWIFKYST